MGLMELSKSLKSQRMHNSMDINTLIKINVNDVPVYEPAGHYLTYNRRLAGYFNGSDNLEFVIGEMHKGGGAENHLHSNLDQMIFMLEGELEVISPGRNERIVPNDLVVFLKNTEHEVHCVSDKARFIVLYAPPHQK